MVCQGKRVVFSVCLFVQPFSDNYFGHSASVNHISKDAWHRGIGSSFLCKYHTSNDVFSRCTSVLKMASRKGDDELIQLHDKIRIWTRSGKFRKVENPELSMDCMAKHDADANDNIYDCVALHDAYTTDHFH